MVKKYKTIPENRLAGAKLAAIHAIYDDIEFIMASHQKAAWFEWIADCIAKPIPKELETLKAGHAANSCGNFLAFVFLRQVYGVEAMMQHKAATGIGKIYAGIPGLNLATNVWPGYDVQKIRDKRAAEELKRKFLDARDAKKTLKPDNETLTFGVSPGPKSRRRLFSQPRQTLGHTHGGSVSEDARPRKRIKPGAAPQDSIREHAVQPASLKTEDLQTVADDIDSYSSDDSLYDQEWCKSVDEKGVFGSIKTMKVSSTFGSFPERQKHPTSMMMDIVNRSSFTLEKLNGKLFDDLVSELFNKEALDEFMERLPLQDIVMPPLNYRELRELSAEIEAIYDEAQATGE